MWGIGGCCQSAQMVGVFFIYLFIFLGGGGGGRAMQRKRERRVEARRAASLMLPCHGHAGSSNWPPY